MGSKTRQRKGKKSTIGKGTVTSSPKEPSKKRSPSRSIRNTFLSPGLDADTDCLADWLELKAFSSKHGSVLLREIIDIEDIGGDRAIREEDASVGVDGVGTKDDELEDWSIEDGGFEDTLSRVAALIHRRESVLEAAYPFRMSPEGEKLSISDEWGVGSAIYLFCLIMSHATNSQLIPDELIPRNLKEARDLFQICATLGASGICKGPAFSIGHPRPDGSTFIAKLRSIYTMFGDGRPKRRIPPEGSRQVKDGGIDVIAWTPERDGRSGSTNYLLGQAASGNNWRDKGVRHEIDTWHSLWFEMIPSSVPKPFMFIPFDVPVDDEKHWADTSRLGHLCYRCTLPFFADKTPELIESGITPIERFDEISNIISWVQAHRKYLREVVL